MTQTLGEDKKKKKLNWSPLVADEHFGHGHINNASRKAGRMEHYEGPVAALESCSAGQHVSSLVGSHFK